MYLLLANNYSIIKKYMPKIEIYICVFNIIIKRNGVHLKVHVYIYIYIYIYMK